MLPSRLTLQLVLRQEPVAALGAVKGAVSGAGALITGSSRFSNKALSFELELDVVHLGELHASLAALGHLSPDAEVLTVFAAPLAPDDEVVAHLHVTVVHGEPDQRIEQPKAPG